MNLIVTNSNETPKVIIVDSETGDNYQAEFKKFEGKELKRQTFSFDKSHQDLTDFIAYVNPNITDYKLIMQMDGTSAYITINFLSPYKFKKNNSITLFTFDLKALLKRENFDKNPEDFAGYPLTFSQSMMAVSDRANGLLGCQLVWDYYRRESDGELIGNASQFNLNVKTVIPKLRDVVEVAQENQTWEQAYCIKFEMPLWEEHLLDELCDKFYWGIEQ